MVGNIRDVLKIKTPEDMYKAFHHFEIELDQHLIPLDELLDKNILSGDVTDMEGHMAAVECWRNRASKYLYLADAFVEYAKSQRFALGGNVTDAMRRQYEKTLSGPCVALQRRLENLIDNIDSRVNLCKKRMGVETSVGGVRMNTNRGNRYAA